MYVRVHRKHVEKGFFVSFHAARGCFKILVKLARPDTAPLFRGACLFGMAA